jgi:hypothetical protein
MSECKRKECNKLAKETNVVDSQDPERRAPKSEAGKEQNTSRTHLCSQSIVIYYNDFHQFSMAVS